MISQTVPNTQTAPDISVVVPLYNEEESLPELCDWIVRVMDEHQFSYEILLVNDGSQDNSWAVILGLGEQNPHIKGIRFQRNYGKSAALNMGFRAALGKVVITMDADLQDSPDEIPELFRMIQDEKFDMVSGWKKNRKDPLSKTIPTKLYNAVTRKFSGIKLHDFNCGLKAYRSPVVKSIEVYGEMHRYIPVLAKWSGFNKIGEKVVVHQERKFGKTKFGLERFLYGFLDLLSVTLVTRFRKRPMHFFGSLGTLSFLIGGLIAISLIIDQRFFFDQDQSIITRRPLFYLSLVAVIIGVQMFLAGFLGELMTTNAHHADDYLISETSNLNPPS